MIGMPGGTELLIILLVVVLFFGARKLPEIGGGLGRAIKNFKKATNEPDEIDITPSQSQQAEDESKKDDNAS